MFFQMFKYSINSRSFKILSNKIVIVLPCYCVRYTAPVAPRKAPELEDGSKSIEVFE